MSINSNPKLKIELVPKTCHFSNVRTCLPKSDWDKIRKLSYENANHKCEICGDTGKNQGFRHNVECHEIWEYDEYNLIQKLIGLISLCPTCHMVKHIGRAMAMGKQEVCYRQLAKVNKWTEPQIKEHIVESFNKHKGLSMFEWKLDISMLSQEPYNIDLSDFKERIFENRFTKKKQIINEIKTEKISKEDKKKEKKKEKKRRKKQKLKQKAKLNKVLNSDKLFKSKRPPKK